MTQEDHSKSIEDQLADIQTKLAEIEVGSDSSSVEGKSTTVERGDSAESWDDENIDNWCKKVDELISSYTSRPNRIAKRRLRHERKISVENKCKVTKLRRKKLRQKRQKRTRSGKKSSSLANTDKRLMRTEKMLESLSNSPPTRKRQRVKTSRRSTESTIRKKKKKSSSKHSSESESLSPSLNSRMDNIQLLLDAARDSSESSSRSSELSHVSDTLHLLKNVFGSLAGRPIRDKELISELIQMQTRVSA